MKIHLHEAPIEFLPVLRVLSPSIYRNKGNLINKQTRKSTSAQHNSSNETAKKLDTSLYIPIKTPFTVACFCFPFLLAIKTTPRYIPGSSLPSSVFTKATRPTESTPTTGSLPDSKGIMDCNSDLYFSQDSRFVLLCIHMYCFTVGRSTAGISSRPTELPSTRRTWTTKKTSPTTITTKIPGHKYFVQKK